MNNNIEEILHVYMEPTKAEKELDAYYDFQDWRKSFTALVTAELLRARTKFPTAMNSTHEGYAVLLEEVDELWDEIKQGGPPHRVLAELVQIAAMAQRLAEDVVRHA